VYYKREGDRGRNAGHAPDNGISKDERFVLCPRDDETNPLGIEKGAMDSMNIIVAMLVYILERTSPVRALASAEDSSIS
jgi:hypothetical protein